MSQSTAIYVTQHAERPRDSFGNSVDVLSGQSAAANVFTTAAAGMYRIVADAAKYQAMIA